jgi:uncharacterized C2H2 Zn-finger protein
MPSPKTRPRHRRWGKKSSSSTGKLVSAKHSKKRFKCSKCQEKFRNRQACLRHIQNAHSLKKQRLLQGRKLHFSSSPLKRNSGARAQARSQYVRQLMELLRVPTSRGTPQSPDAAGSSENNAHKQSHIMQPFLLKAPAPMSPSSGEESEDVAVNAEINFVPSLVYLPVAKRVSQPLTVAFNLTPA